MTDYAKEARRAKREGDYSKAGDMFFLAGDARSALECYVSGNHLFLAARLLEKIEDWKGAARYYIQCGKYLDAAEIYAHRLRDFRSASLMFEKQGDLVRASEMAERAGEIIRAALMAEQADFKERAANLYMRAKKYERAAEVYFRFLQQLLKEKQEKGFLESHRSLVARVGNAAGMLFIKLKNYDRAAYCYEETDNIDKAAECYALSGHPEKAAHLYYRLQDYEKAYQVLAKLNPKSLDRELLADVSFHLKKYAEAADIYLSLQRPVRAAEALEHANELHRAALLFESAEEYDRAAEVYLRLNERFRAAEFYEKAKNFTYAAKLYEEAGNVEKAISCLSASGQSLHAAQLLIKREDTQQAIALLQQISPDHDDYSEATALLGSLFSRMGMYSVALQKFQESLGGKPLGRDNIDVYYEMAVAWEKANYYSKAREIYEKLVAEQFGYKDVLSRLDRIKNSNLVDGASEATSTTSQRILANRYELIERIGKDAFGLLYKAQDTSLGRTVMIRRLPEQDDNITRSLVDQTRAVSSLSHSNILAIYDSGKDGNYYYICTEFIEGLTLREHLSKGHPDISEICEIATQICLGLAYAHKKGVIHRFLSPENIYIGGGQVKVAHFGFETATEKAATLVARQYTSPEQILGERPDARSDLYSFGVILYEMLYGKPPFFGSNVDQEHLHKTPAFQESSQRFTPSFLIKIIQKCLEKDRVQRYANADEIVEELEVADIVPGMVLNERYEIIKELGTGGMGHVYQARDRDLDEVVALKVLRAEISADPIIQKRFVREIKVARMITHPNVVKVFDIGKYKGNRYISMEFIQGTSLDEWLRSHPKNDTRVQLSILARIIQGVQAAHAQGIVHRDLKPQNVILDRSLNPRVLDFGIARSKEAVEAEGTSSGQILGSPKYMSPEQIQGRDLDIRTDIYSLGVIMFFMFTGQEPFTGDDPRAIIMKHLTQPPPDMLKINPAVPAWLERIVMKAMEKDRNRRYAVLKDLLDDLKKGYENLK